MATSIYPSRAFPVHQLPPVQPADAVEEYQESGLQKLGFNFLLVFLFLAFSRIFDVKFGALHITGASYRVVFAMVILSRGFVTSLKTPIGKAFLGFTICFGMSVPFSIWKGGSI